MASRRCVTNTLLKEEVRCGLYVMGTIGLGAAQRRLRQPTSSRRHEETILEDIDPNGPACRYRTRGCHSATGAPRAI